MNVISERLTVVFSFPVVFYVVSLRIPNVLFSSSLETTSASSGKKGIFLIQGPRANFRRIKRC